MDLNLEIVMCGTIINEDTSAVREPFQETHSTNFSLNSSKFNDSRLSCTMHNRQFLLIFQRSLSLLIVRNSTRKILVVAHEII